MAAPAGGRSRGSSSNCAGTLGRSSNSTNLLGTYTGRSSGSSDSAEVARFFSGSSWTPVVGRSSGSWTWSHVGEFEL